MASARMASNDSDKMHSERNQNDDTSPTSDAAPDDGTATNNDSAPTDDRTPQEKVFSTVELLDEILVNTLPFSSCKQPTQTLKLWTVNKAWGHHFRGSNDIARALHTLPARRFRRRTYVRDLYPQLIKRLPTCSRCLVSSGPTYEVRIVVSRKQLSWNDKAWIGFLLLLPAVKKLKMIPVGGILESRSWWQPEVRYPVQHDFVASETGLTIGDVLQAGREFLLHKAEKCYYYSGVSFTAFVDKDGCEL